MEEEAEDRLAERAAGLEAMAEPVAALEHREHLRTLIQLLRRLAVDPAGALYRGSGRAAKPDTHAVRLLERDGVLHAGWSVAAMVAAPEQHAAAVQQHQRRPRCNRLRKLLPQQQQRRRQSR